MRRGFKTEAKYIAREVRTELSLSRTAALDVRRLADHLDIPLIPLSSLCVEAPKAAELFLNGGEGMFSGVTVFLGHHRTIIFNDAHSPGRQANDIGHELSHGLLLHPATAAMDGRGCRLLDRRVEEEADWLSGALLVPEEAAFSIVRRGFSLDQAADMYGVSKKLIQFRINVTGARARVQRAAPRFR